MRGVAVVAVTVLHSCRGMSLLVVGEQMGDAGKTLLLPTVLTPRPNCGL